MGCDFTEASAKTCVNVEKGMTSLLKQQHLFNFFIFIFHAVSVLFRCPTNPQEKVELEEGRIF